MILIIDDNQSEPINLNVIKRDLEKSIFDLINDFNRKTKISIVSVDILTHSTTGCGKPQMVAIKTTTDI